MGGHQATGQPAARGPRHRQTTIQYAPVAKGMSPVTGIEALAPLAVRMDAPLPRLYAGYAKLGFGMYTSPYADIHLGETQSRKGAWGLPSTTAARPAPRVLWTASAWMKAGPTTVSMATSAASSTEAASRWMQGCSPSVGTVRPRSRTRRHGGLLWALWIGSYLTADVSVRLQNHLRDSAKVHRDLELAMSRLMPGASPRQGMCSPPTSCRPTNAKTC